MVYVESFDGSKHLTRALLDQGAQMSFISEPLARHLHLKRSQTSLQVTGLGSSKPLTAKGLVKFKIFSYHNPYVSFMVQAIVLNKLTSYVPVNDVSITKCSHLKGLNLADPIVNERHSLDIILGADVYSNVIQDGLVKGPMGYPIAQKTSLGWIITGTFLRNFATNRVSLTSLQCNLDEKLYELLRRYVMIEDIPSKNCKFTLEDNKCDTFFNETYERNLDGRYIVRLPFKEPTPELGDSRIIAYKMLLNLEKRFEKNLSFKEAYVKCIDEYISLGEMTEITDLNELKSSVGYFLPHHGVVKEMSSSTKLRVVFNASQKTNLGISLNDLLCSGPKLQNDISRIILRWRLYPFVFVADIEKMFRRIWVHPQDRTYQKILWRKNVQDDIRTYCLNTVTFGFAASPYLALRTLHQLRVDEGNNFPLTVGVIEEETYVDDVLSGEFEIDTAAEKVHEVDSLFRAGGFVLKKWISNHPEILRHIAEDCKPATSEWEPESEISSKPLGILWSPITDCFQIKVVFSNETKTITKRSVLSDVARIYDPLGWLSPVTIKAKIFLQELWKLKFEWDEDLTDSLLKSWSKHKDELSSLCEITIPRYINYSKDVIACELHGFGDASEKAIGAVIYLRLVLRDDTIHVSLLTAKTKVAKVKEVSIPRLELCAAVLLVRLMLHVTSTMESFSKLTHKFWTDSKNTLFWIQSHPSRWNTFISNRVSEIQSSFPKACWSHVSGVDNPADCASRGISTSSLKQHPLWWKGPDWLSQPCTSWPVSDELIVDNPHLEERVIKTANTVTQSLPWEFFSRYSSFPRLIRITAIILYFVKRLKNIPGDSFPHFSSVSAFQEARNCLIVNVQSYHFSQEIDDLRRRNRVLPSSCLLNLSPFLDSNGLLRLGGRLMHADLDFDERCPIILPFNSPLTSLIILNGHRFMLHGGTQLTLSYLRRTYWIIKGRLAVKKVLSRCVPCARFRAKTCSQLMSPLPASRVTQPSRPFAIAGVDYAGPIWIRTSKGRGHKAYKGYIGVFVCFATKSVHLEVCSDYTAEGFIAAYKRFSSRRGVCNTLHSDCGTNFVGADRELRDLFNKSSSVSQAISRYLANNGTTWRFNPPAAPHFGGLWESAVRSVKHHLRRVMGSMTLTFEEMSTFLSEVEACLNSRPLQALTEDPNDLVPLTPSHFLIGSLIYTIPEPSYSEQKLTSLRRWRLISKMKADFWSRWSSEYLHTLQTRPKWQFIQSPLKLNDLVVIRNENLPPSKWALGRVIDLHAGKDGLIRTATLKTASGSLVRPIVKLCVLPICTDS